MGEHRLSFAVMPHLGRLVESDVPKEALRFTNPIRGSSQHRLRIGVPSSRQYNSEIDRGGPQEPAIIRPILDRGSTE